MFGSKEGKPTLNLIENWLARVAAERHVDRSDRFRIPCSKTTRYLQSFIPTSIRTLNQQAGRQRQYTTARDGDEGDDEAGIKWKNVWESMGGSCLCKWIVIWKSRNMCCWRNVLLYNKFYGRPCHFCNGLMKLSCILHQVSCLSNYPT